MYTVSRERESAGGKGRERERRQTVGTTWTRLCAKLDPPDGAVVPSADAQLPRLVCSASNQPVSPHLYDSQTPFHASLNAQHTGRTGASAFHSAKIQLMASQQKLR